MSTVEPYSAAAVGTRLSTRWLGRRLTFLPEVGSTNDWLWQRAQAGEPAGTVVFTDLQTSGRGRLGRRWVTPPGTAVLCSQLFRPGWSVDRAGWLTMLAGVAAAEVCAAAAGIPVRLKWPNDVVVEHDGALRKLGGILLDSSIVDERVTVAVVGIGLNVNLTAAELPAAAMPPTSLRIETGRSFARAPLLADLLNRLEAHIERAERGFSPYEEWNALLALQNRPVRVRFGDGGRVDGVALATDASGRLVVRDEHGVTHTIAAGDVTLRPG